MTFDFDPLNSSSDPAELGGSALAPMLESILELSYRISVAVPAMKPFVRFAAPGRRKLPENGSYAQRFWDFDDMLQKKLLELAYAAAPPQAIVQACTARWERNLEALVYHQKSLLEQVRGVKEGAAQLFSHPRLDQIVGLMKPGERFLYIGCGMGRECLSLAGSGLSVTGIDTNEMLLNVAREWAVHYRLDAHYACMDVMATGWSPASFDGFLLEFYGSLPTAAQVSCLHDNLKWLLRPGGIGIISANRKRYVSYWHRMGSPYPPALMQWMIPCGYTDFLFSGVDGCEERLQYGLYKRTHTVQSLSAELSASFEVMDCYYEKTDPRYVIALVKPGPTGRGAAAHPPASAACQPEPAPFWRGDIQTELDAIQHLCVLMESHARGMIACFQVTGVQQIDACLTSMADSVEVQEFMDGLMALFQPDRPAAFKS